jgi:hypothetical protein
MISSSSTSSSTSGASAEGWLMKTRAIPGSSSSGASMVGPVARRWRCSSNRQLGSNSSVLGIASSPYATGPVARPSVGRDERGYNPRQHRGLAPGSRLGVYEIVARLASSAWVRSIVRATPSFAATWRSRCWRRNSQLTPTGWRASNARHRRWRPSPTPTSSRSSTSATTAASVTRSPSCSRVGRCARRFSQIVRPGFVWNARVADAPSQRIRLLGQSQSLTGRNTQRQFEAQQPAPQAWRRLCSLE